MGNKKKNKSGFCKTVYFKLVIQIIVLSLLTTGVLGYINFSKATYSIGLDSVANFSLKIGYETMAFALQMAVDGNIDFDEFENYLLNTKCGKERILNFLSGLTITGEVEDTLLIRSDGTILATKEKFLNDDKYNLVDELLNLKETQFDRDYFLNSLQNFNRGNIINTNVSGMAISVYFSRIVGTDLIVVSIPGVIMSSSAQELLLTMIVGIILSIIVSIIFALWKANDINTPLESIQLLANKLSKKDLTYRISVKNTDEFGITAKKLNIAAKSMRSALLNVQKAKNATKDMIKTTKDKIDIVTGKAKSVSADTEHILAQVEESVVAIENIVNKLADIKERGEKITDESIKNVSLSNDIKINAKKANIDKEKMREETNKIFLAAKIDLEEALKNFDNIKEIKNMAEVITSLSNKTNILSINASIEAAKAGEHGRGFNVLALEIGNLAMMSARTASDIQALAYSVDKTLSQTISASENILMVMNSNMEKSYNILTKLSAEYEMTGNDIYHMLNSFKNDSVEMSESLSEIYASVESLSELMDVVNQSSESIALDVNNISLEMSEVLNISEMNSKNMEELSNLISTFKTERDE